MARAHGRDPLALGRQRAPHRQAARARLHPAHHARADHTPRRRSQRRGDRRRAPSRRPPYPPRPPVQRTRRQISTPPPQNPLGSVSPRRRTAPARDRQAPCHLREHRSTTGSATAGCRPGAARADGCGSNSGQTSSRTAASASRTQATSTQKPHTGAREVQYETTVGTGSRSYRPPLPATISSPECQSMSSQRDRGNLAGAQP